MVVNGLMLYLPGDLPFINFIYLFLEIFSNVQMFLAKKKKGFKMLKYLPKGQLARDLHFG